jgi:transposase
MSEKLNTAVAVMGIDIGKNSFHVIGLDARGAIACDKSGHAARWKRGSPTCRRA